MAQPAPEGSQRMVQRDKRDGTPQGSRRTPWTAVREPWLRCTWRMRAASTDGPACTNMPCSAGQWLMNFSEIRF
jgi:hypothetical protein